MYFEQLCILSGDVKPNPGPSSISLCHLNIRSLSYEKILAIKHQLAGIYDIIALTETFLTENSSHNLDIDNYHPIFRRDRGAHGGGVAAYISSNYIVKQRHDLMVADVECLWIEIRSNNNKFLLAVCYRPPNANADYWENIQFMIDNVRQDSCNHIILAGDFNADPNTMMGRKLDNFCNINNFTLHINEPTRITEHSHTILDQFITNIPQFVKDSSVLAPLSTNDHCTITLTLSFKKTKTCAYKRLIWLYNRADFEGMNSFIQEYAWDQCFDNDDIDVVCQNWTTSFLNIARQFIPNKVVEIRPRDAPWFNSELRKLKRHKDKMHKKAKTTHSVDDWANFRSLRNQYTNKLREAEKMHRESLATSLKHSKQINPKHWWHITKQFMGKNKENSIPPMEENNITYFNPKDKADAFNKAFLSFSRLDTTGAHLPDLTYRTAARIDNIPILESDVLDILKSLDTSKASGPDGISAKMLKETAHSIAPSLTKLFQKSYNLSKIPHLWKEANVLPLHKKGNKSSFANYRPISLLCLVSKVYEKLIFKYVFNYLRDHDIITVHQSGFTPGDSTVNQLLYMYNMFCKALNDKKDVRIVFCDQSKAFDRVWHEGLLFKLKCIGISGKLLEWFSDYLKNRKQKVVINGIISDILFILAGVPQGSVLGPLLFLIYINDITDGINAGIKLFADDTSLYIIFDGNDVNQATEVLNSDLQTVNEWAKKWLVTFNPQKTKSLYISLRKNLNPPPLTFDGHILENIDSHKHLGIELNTKLTWNNHIDTIAASADKKINLLAHLKHLLDRKTLLTMYQSFIRPSLEYGCIIWCNCTDTDNDSIEKVQRRALRIISGGIISTHSKCLYDELAVEPLKVRRDRQVLLMFHKIIHDNVPNYLQELKPTTVNQRQGYHLRRDNIFSLPRCRITKYQKSFMPHAITLWNQLPTATKNILEYEKFKDKLESKIPTENPLFNFGSRRESIIMARFRMNCSELNAYLFSINVADSPACACGFDSEDTVHYFTSCPLYNIPRAVLINTVAHLAPFTLHTILYGNKDLSFEDNKSVYLATLTYIIKTKRFEPP